MGLSFNWAYNKWPITTTGKAFKGPTYNWLIIGISGHDCVELSMSWSLVSVIVFKYRYFFTGYVAWAQHLKASWWTPRKSFAVFGTYLADLFYFAHAFYPILGLFLNMSQQTPLQLVSFKHFFMGPSPPQPQPATSGVALATGDAAFVGFHGHWVHQHVDLAWGRSAPCPGGGFSGPMAHRHVGGKRGMARQILVHRCGTNALIMDEAKKIDYFDYSKSWI